VEVDRLMASSFELESDFIEEKIEEIKKIEEVPPLYMSEEDIAIPIFLVECIDSDEGPNYFQKGKVSWINPDKNQEEVFQDRCKEKTLIEEYCRDGKRDTIYYGCKNGCQDGMCISE